GSERRVPRAEALADGNDVGLDRQLVRGQPASNATDAGHHLVEADQEPVFLPAFGEAAPEAFRWRAGGESGRAHGFAEERGDLAAVPLEQAVELGEGVVAGRVEAPRRGRQVQVRREVRRVRLLDGWPSVEGQRAHR